MASGRTSILPLDVSKKICFKEEFEVWMNYPYNSRKGSWVRSYFHRWNLRAINLNKTSSCNNLLKYSKILFHFRMKTVCLSKPFSPLNHRTLAKAPLPFNLPCLLYQHVVPSFDDKRMNKSFQRFLRNKFYLTYYSFTNRSKSSKSLHLLSLITPPSSSTNIKCGRLLIAYSSFKHASSCTSMMIRSNAGPL